MSVDVVKVLEMLLPEGGWALSGDKFEDVQFIEAEPITKAQFDKGCKDYESWKANKDAEVAAKKAEAEAKLIALGISLDDLRLLGWHSH
jgi:hypothetical protein